MYTCAQLGQHCFELMMDCFLTTTGVNLLKFGKMKITFVTILRFIDELEVEEEMQQHGAMIRPFATWLYNHHFPSATLIAFDFQYSA